MNHSGKDADQSRIPQPRDYVRAARDAISRGFCAIPLKPGTKRPYATSGWQNDFASDEGEELAWDPRGDWAGCNVGILTERSGLVVLDPDVKDGIDGIANLRAKCGEVGLDPDEVFDTYTVRTPSGGLHLYFKAPIGPPPVGRDLCEGVNTRSRGQLVVAAGSYTPKGPDTAEGWYTVEKERPVRRLPVEFAAILARREDSPDQIKKFTDSEARDYVEAQGLRALREAGPGERNNRLNAAAVVMGHFVPDYWLEDEAQELLSEAALECGLTDPEEVVPTIRSGLRFGMSSWTAVRPDHPKASNESRLTWNLVPGAEFILSTPEQTPAIWGTGDQVLWAEGEPLIITGPTGVGKTTVGAQLVLGRIGQLDSLLGFGITEGHGRLLYLACDRPKQIARALRRTFKDVDPAILNERLVFQKGPPPRDLARNPEMLLELAQEVGADTVIIDSIKDVAVKLSDEETGQGLHRAFQLCIAADIEVAAYHHQRKSNGEGSKPRHIDDMYGSAWIAAGAGSVVLIWGKAGDSRVELDHLKQPAEKVGPLNLVHDHRRGVTSIAESEPQLIDFLVEQGTDGVTVRQAAEFMAGDTTEPNDAVVERARRALNKFVKDKSATVEKNGDGTSVYSYVFPHAGVTRTSRANDDG